MADTQIDIPARIRSLRLERKLSQAELAERVGVAQTAISQFETGAKTPRLDTLMRLASAFGISTAMLMESGEETHDA